MSNDTNAKRAWTVLYTTEDGSGYGHGVYDTREAAEEAKTTLIDDELDCIMDDELTDDELDAERRAMSGRVIVVVLTTNPRVGDYEPIR
jgi:hypothetical protein